MSNIISTANNERGSVIVVALIILALLTILGISSTSTSNMEVRIASNSQEHQMDFYVADSGWKDAAMCLEAECSELVSQFWPGETIKAFGDFADPAQADNIAAADDGIDNNNNGHIDETGETTFSRHNILYYYEVFHVDPPQVMAGSGNKYKRHFFTVTSDAKRRDLPRSTAEVQVSLSKIFKEGYN